MGSCQISKNEIGVLKRGRLSRFCYCKRRGVVIAISHFAI
ncbi:hypothetical protein SUBVAR_06320 [Subdoligranulum variabile DSM 15176]|uniref:Uncharacterized protein n=1 Tax=Subdoligranulum variabile DSM 15176 TaxID=411471 RepID=D1PPK4_9FIRM|nr:hypothetical protein SUBVAR_06320 [Subdoligranulum variabile DSM 15176]